jgi:hypothetical protein
VWGSYGRGKAPRPLHWIILEACGASDLGSNPSTGVAPIERRGVRVSFEFVGF